MPATASERPAFPSRAKYLFTGLPLAFLLNSLLVFRITPALWDPGRNLVSRNIVLSPPYDPYQYIVIGVAVIALLLTGWLAFLGCRRRALAHHRQG